MIIHHLKHSYLRDFVPVETSAWEGRTRIMIWFEYETKRTIQTHRQLPFSVAGECVALARDTSHVGQRRGIAKRLKPPTEQLPSARAERTLACSI